MTFEHPLWMDNGGSYSAAADRHLIYAALPNPGVMGYTELRVTERGTGANQSVDISNGRCVLPEGAGIQRHYIGSLTGGSVFNLALNAPPVSNSRYDLIYAELRDATVSGSNNDWRITFVEGASASSPAVPALPNARCIPLAAVLRVSGDATVNNAEITDMRQVVQGWAPYSPVWATSANQPIVGSDGVLLGRYMFKGLKHVRFEVKAYFGSPGSGAYGGTGYYRWSLPFQAAATQLSQVLGSAYFLRVDSTSQRIGVVKLLTNTQVELTTVGTQEGITGNVAHSLGDPFLTPGFVGWGNNTGTEFYGEYEIA